MRASLDPQAKAIGSANIARDAEIGRHLCLGTGKTVTGSGATPALDFTKGTNLRWTPDHATPAPTAAVPGEGTLVLLTVVTWGSASTVTFGTGFKTGATLVIGTTTGNTWSILFISDGTSLIELFRSALVVA